MAQVLSRIQRQYGPKGVQFIAACFNDGAEKLVPAFIQQFQPSFPIGYSDHDTVHTWLGYSLMKLVYVPILAFVDARGAVQAQFTGTDDFMLSHEPNIMAKLDLMLQAAGTAPAAAKKAAPAKAPVKK